MRKGRLIIYFKQKRPNDLFFWGDRMAVQFIKKLLFGKKIGSLEKVYLNLCAGLDKLRVPYLKNLSFKQIKPDDQIIVLGTGKHALEGFHHQNKIIAGIGLITHPNQWPNMFKDYPIAVYLQHSKWTAAIYNKWYGENSCKIWPAGIDTDYWEPKKAHKDGYLLVYVKFLWNREENNEHFLAPILNQLDQKSIPYKIITYGNYDIQEYKSLLEDSIGMIFICEHESQGLAYQEAMAMNVPIFAWDQGLWLDKSQAEWGETKPIPASSVPYFDVTCGETFKNIEEFNVKLDHFYQQAKLNHYHPRAYVLKHLSLTRSAEIMLQIIEEVYQ